MIAENFVSYARHKLAEHHAQIVRAASLCTPEQVWHRSNGHCNSIGNLLLHLTGNVTQWIICGLGGTASQRNRPAEFAERGPLPLQPILDKLAQTIRDADAVLAVLPATALSARHSIQGYDVTGVEVVFHVVEHFAFHTGQVVHMTKALRDCDLSLYDAQGRRTDGRRDGAV